MAIRAPDGANNDNNNDNNHQNGGESWRRLAPGNFARSIPSRRLGPSSSFPAISCFGNGWLTPRFKEINFDKSIHKLVTVGADGSQWFWT